MIGVDYSAHAGLNVPAFEHAGVRFVVRYLTGGMVGKQLTADEVAGWHAAGIGVAVVWETTALRAEDGYQAGQDDAHGALVALAAVGAPPQLPVYLAVDEDTTVGPHITGYFQGAASVIPHPRIGVYGGLRVVQGCLDARLAAYAWQTRAWSGTPVEWDPRAQLRQLGTTTTIAGTVCDWNVSTVDDFGAWWPGGVTPGPSPSPATCEVDVSQLPVLQAGSTGAGVRVLEGLLNAGAAVGLCPSVGIDTGGGLFGPQCETAVRAYQLHLGLTVDGIVGPATYRRLLALP